MNPLESLRSLGHGTPPPPGAEERVFERVLSAVSPLALQKLDLSPHGAADHGRIFRGALWQSKPVAMFGAWLLGGVMGAAIYASVRSPEVRVVYQQSATVSSAGDAVPAPPLAPALSTQPSVPVVGTKAPPVSGIVGLPLSEATQRVELPAPRSQSLLALERALLDDARAKSAKGSSEEVLKAAELHRQRFPDGKLAEEREALAIHALLNLGRRHEARVRAQAFQAQFPHSLLSSAIEPALSP